MTPRLKDILERCKAKADTQTTTEVQGDSDTDTPALILVPFFDIITTDEYSEYF